MKKILAGIKEARRRHRERHRPTGFQFALADSIRFLNESHWDAVTASAGFFLRRSYLAVLEDCEPQDFYSRYALIYRAGKPVAAVAAQLLTITADRLMARGKSKKPNLLKLALTPAARTVAGMRDRVMVCGNLFSWGCDGVAFAPDVAPEEVWPGVTEALYRIRRAERLAGETNLIFIKELATAQQPAAQVLRRFSFRPVETEPDMVLDLKPEWRAYADYLGSLDRKYRKSAQQIAEDITTAGCVVEKIEDLAPHGERLHELYLAVHENAGMRPATLPVNYFPTLARGAGEDFSCIAVRRENQILGFVTVVRDGERAVGYYIGYDRAAAATLPLYLRLLHAVVEQSLAWGCRRLSLGRTALEPKARLGAKPQPLFIWARHRDSTLNFFVRKLVQAIPHDVPPERNPFKSVPAESKRPPTADQATL